MLACFNTLLNFTYSQILLHDKDNEFGQLIPGITSTWWHSTKKYLYGYNIYILVTKNVHDLSYPDIPCHDNRSFSHSKCFISIS